MTDEENPIALKGATNHRRSLKGLCYLFQNLLMQHFQSRTISVITNQPWLQRETKLIFWATRCKNELHRTLPQSWSCLCPCSAAWWDKSSQIAWVRFCNLFKAKDYLIRASSLIMLWGLTLFGAEGFLLKVHHHPVKAAPHTQTLCYCWGHNGSFTAVTDLFSGCIWLV